MLDEILQPFINVALGRFNHAVCNIHLPHLLRLKGHLLLRCGLCVLHGAFLCLGLDLRLKAVSGAPVVLHQVFLFDHAIRDLHAGQFIEHLLRQLRAHVELPQLRVAHALPKDELVHDLGAVLRVADADTVFRKNGLVVAQRFAGRRLRRFHFCLRLLCGFLVRLDLAFQGFHKRLARKLRADIILPDHCRRHLEALRLRPHLECLIHILRGILDDLVVRHRRKAQKAVAQLLSFQHLLFQLLRRISPARIFSGNLLCQKDGVHLIDTVLRSLECLTGLHLLAVLRRLHVGRGHVPADEQERREIRRRSRFDGISDKELAERLHIGLGLAHALSLELC